MRKSLASAAALLGVAMVGGTMHPAAAATGYARCDAGNFCIFSDPNGSGAIAQFSVGDWDLGDGVGPQGMNNNAESFFNRSSYSWDLWDYANGGGGSIHLLPNDKGNFGATWSNRVTSLHYY